MNILNDFFQIQHVVQQCFCGGKLYCASAELVFFTRGAWERADYLYKMCVSVLESVRNATSPSPRVYPSYYHYCRQSVPSAPVHYIAPLPPLCGHGLVF